MFGNCIIPQSLYTHGVPKGSVRFQLKFLSLGNSKDYGKTESHLKDSVPLLTLSLPEPLQLDYHKAHHF
jgi:hypothetical protein